MPDVDVVHRSEHLLVVNKPSGIATTAPDNKPCLTRDVGLIDPTAPNLHPTSRLDAEVTGLVTYARTKQGNMALQRARSAGKYRRMYVAISSGAPEPSEGTWQGHIAIDPTEPRRRVMVPPKHGGKRSCTNYRTAAEAAGFAWLELWPRTGRTHQLRLHASELGQCPLAGDIHYGGERRAVQPDGRVVRFPRVMLHCRALSLPNPSGGAPLELEAPLPDDLLSVWKKLLGDPETITAISFR